MEHALAEAGRVLAIRGRVLPSTLQDITLEAEVRALDGTLRRVSGELHIAQTGGLIERVFLEPAGVRAYPATIQAVLGAELIVFGPGSLYTSILPSLLVGSLTEAIRAANAPCIYVCNIATQAGETDHFSVADHVAVLEKHIGRGVINGVLCNNTYPTLNKGANTHYVHLTNEDQARLSYFPLHSADLTDYEHPWRHDSHKLAQAIFALCEILMPVTA